MVGDILQPTHLLFILVVALLVLGPKRLPEAGRSLGRAMRDFRSAMSGHDAETPEPVITQTAPQPAAPTPPVVPDASVPAEHPTEPAGTTAPEVGEHTPPERQPTPTP